ncbi:MAG: hypothetical protein ACI8TQ_001829, partial [Planctomycetota bacterium]
MPFLSLFPFSRNSCGSQPLSSARAAGFRRFTGIAPLLISLISLSPFVAGQDSIPAGLEANDWAAVRSLYEAGRHAAIETDGGFEARNPNRGWNLNFDGRGFSVAPDSGSWSWGLDLKNYGFSGHEQSVGDEAVVRAEGARVTNQWDASLEEWYKNGVNGFEHGFTLNERPNSTAILNDTDSSAPLNFTLRVRGELSPVVDSNDETILNCLASVLIAAHLQAATEFRFFQPSTLSPLLESGCTLRPFHS